MIPSKFLSMIVALIPLVPSIAAAQSRPEGHAELDLTRAVIVAASNAGRVPDKALNLLVDEVYKRTLVRWPITRTWPSDSTPVIVVSLGSSLNELAGARAPKLPAQSDGKGAEGYRLITMNQGGKAPTVLVLGNDARGVLFGVGRLLRTLRMTRGHVAVPADLDIATAPRFALRGHQLGYRPKTNSYDGWTLPLWEQYFRDLAVFGTNAIELIPPRSDDDADSPHFPLPPLEMMIGMSKLCDDYGLDVWIWYPAMDRDYAEPATVDFALREWSEVFKKLPRIDAVFVPGGDPGHTQPKYLMALLQKQTESLHRYHPKAQMWVSPQSFSKEWLDEFGQILQQEQPAWLAGVVFGPQVRVSVGQLRQMVPAKYPIRWYPDITHSLRCQYPVPDWDLAYALTESREVINPRPVDQARIFQADQASTNGFITYSEGCNDDVNKIVWSSLGWNPEAKVIDILREYSHYFLGERYTEDFAQGLLALERNWRGPLLTNGDVSTTLAQFQRMEKAATPPDKLNWRFQQALYRAYYDAYERSRLLYETELEERAMEKLGGARKIGAQLAMNEAEAILDRAVTDRVATAWRARVHDLAEALFQSIRMQLSVERYQAIAVGRGASLDTLEVPLNNRLWLKQRFAELRQLTAEADRLAGIESLVTWTDPGPGGFYDDLGDPSRQRHLVCGPGYPRDTEFRQSALLGVTYVPGWRLSWCTDAESLFGAPLKMHYTDLDPTAQYRLRVVYSGDSFKTRIRLLANEDIEVHPSLAKATPVRPVEFDIPAAATKEGELTLTWYPEPGRGGNGRGCQVGEVWLIRKAQKP